MQSEGIKCRLVAAIINTKCSKPKQTPMLNDRKETFVYGYM